VPDDTDSRDEERILADLEAEWQNALSLLNNAAIAITTVTGLTLAAILGFSGAVWTNPSTPMLRICADAIARFSLVLSICMITYLGSDAK